MSAGLSTQNLDTVINSLTLCSGCRASAESGKIYAFEHCGHLVCEICLEHVDSDGSVGATGPSSKMCARCKVVQCASRAQRVSFTVVPLHFQQSFRKAQEDLCAWLPIYKEMQQLHKELLDLIEEKSRQHAMICYQLAVLKIRAKGLKKAYNKQANE
ncbi:hypothetical protein RSOL_035830, partial [Rhizoctonia solani AG-3 Rhs1AP]